MPDLTIIINTEADSPALARVVSISDRRPAGFRDFILGEKLSVALYLIDDSGAYVDESGLGTWFPRLGLGFAGAPVLVQMEPENFVQTPDGNGWAGSFELTTPDLAAVLQRGERRRLLLEFELTDPDGGTRKLMQQEVYVLHRVIDARFLAPGAAPSYLTASESRALFLQNRSAVSNLTGGGATALDGIPSAALTAGMKVLVYLPGTKDLLVYQAVDAAPSVAAPFEVVCADNPDFHWALIGYLGRDLCPPLYNPTQGKWHQLQATGAPGLEAPVLGAAYLIPTA